jgi:protein SCO1/2
MRPDPPLRLTPTSRPRSLAAALAATTLALAALAGCSSSGSGGSDVSNRSGATDAASSTGGPSATGFDGALLPGNLRPYEFTLADQDGRRVSLRALRGRVVVLAFLYTSSKTTAPLIAQQIRGALDELESEHQAPGPRAGVSGQPVTALAVSVDPAADTPTRVRAFLHASSLTGRLEYLTGSLAQLRSIWQAYHVVPAAAGPRAYEEGAFVVVLDRAGVARVEFPLEELTPEALAHDVRKLENE